ncbi:thiol reductant ABC exporter subunit CydD [Nocardiopsis sp. CNT-189]|uniref:thiol reductant ABC exporter subunit CydD n=1 Tax=Nocardiopsis oceanisediminis TaxID=2816862 RepID=UPI003B2A96CC
MRPLDPRLVRTASAVRVHLAVTAASGLAVTGLVLAQAWLLAHTIAGAAGGAGLDELSWAIAAVAAVAIARAALSYGAETAALRSAARAKSQLRRRLVAHVTGAGAEPGGSPGASPPPDREAVRSSGRTGSGGTGTAGELVTLATRGLDALDDYFARYLPQLVLAVLVPIAVLVVVAGADWISALVIAVTVPLIPVFMALVGWHTQARTERRWRLLNRLGGHFLDVVEGLPTLAVFRRAKAQAAVIRRITGEQRRSTMATLRIAFLSAFVLELLATLAVALVAVEIGIRLMYGMLDYETALLVLILAPEAYLPLREVGARFHASMEGVAAAQQVFEELDRRPATAARPGGGEPARVLPGAALGVRFERAGLTYPGREDPALHGVDLEVPAGRRVLITGPSGSGKTSLLSLLLRFNEPTEGRVLALTPDGPVPAGGVAPDEWRRRIAWVPQHPYLFDDTVADNIRLGAPDAADEAVRRAAELAEADGFVQELPDGYRTRLGERGTRLSAGQRQRIALARAFLRDAPVVLLDEPTAHLDPESAAAVRRAVRRLLRDRTALVVAHDTGWASVVDEVVEVRAGRIATEAAR